MSLDVLGAALIAVEENRDLLRGETGPEGPIGPQGPQGIRGPQGTHVAGRDGRDGTDGDPGLLWRGAWKRSTTYAAGDVVESGGSSWVATGPSKGQKPPAGAWDLVAQKGEDGKTIIRTNVVTQGGSGGSALTVKEEGTSLDTAVTSIDFVGAGATATNVGHAVTVTVPNPVTAHEAAGDPHTGYRLESADHTHASSGAQGGTLAGYIPQGGPLTADLVTNDAPIRGSHDLTGGQGGSLFAGNADANGGGVASVEGGPGAAGKPGGAAGIYAGSGDLANDAGASIEAQPGDGAGNAGGIAMVHATLGFFGTAPVGRPSVPLTGPTVQDVIDALVAIGLVTQSD